MAQWFEHSFVSGYSIRGAFDVRLFHFKLAYNSLQWATRFFCCFIQKSRLLPNAVVPWNFAGSRTSSCLWGSGRCIHLHALGFCEHPYANPVLGIFLRSVFSFPKFSLNFLSQDIPLYWEISVFFCVFILFFCENTLQVFSLNLNSLFAKIWSCGKKQTNHFTNWAKNKMFNNFQPFFTTFHAQSIFRLIHARTNNKVYCLVILGSCGGKRNFSILLNELETFFAI